MTNFTWVNSFCVSQVFKIAYMCIFLYLTTLKGFQCQRCAENKAIVSSIPFSVYLLIPTHSSSSQTYHFTYMRRLSWIFFFAFTLYCCSLKARSRHARDSSAIATQALFNDRRTTYLKLHWILWKMWDIFYYLKYIIKKSQISRQKMLILVHKSYWRVCMVDTVQGRHSEKSSRMCINHVYNVEFFFVSVSFTRTGMEVKSPSWRVKINVKCFYKFTRCSLPLIQLHHTIFSSSSFSLSRLCGRAISWESEWM